MAQLLTFTYFEAYRESLGIEPSGLDVKLKIFRFYTSNMGLILAQLGMVLSFILRVLYESPSIILHRSLYQKI